MRSLFFRANFALIVMLAAWSPAQAVNLFWGAGGAGGTGAWNTSNLNWFDGATDVTWNGEGAIFGNSSGTVTISGGVSATSLTFEVPSYLITGSSITLAGPTPITTNFDATISSVLSGSGGIDKLGEATLILGSNHTYIGGTTISSGTLQVNGTIIGNVLNNSSLVFNRSTTQTFEGAISGSGSVSKLGTGTQILIGTNTYTGGTAVSDGVLNFGSAAALPAGGADIFVNVGGAVAFGFTSLDQSLLARVLSFSNGAVALTGDNANALNFNSAGLTSVSLGATGAATYSGVLTPSGTTYRLGGGGGALTVTSALSGANDLVVNSGGPGTVILPNSNNFSGGTTISQGILSVGNDNALGSGTVTFASTGGLSASGGARTIANPVSLASGDNNLSIFSGSNPLTLNGLATANLATGTNRFIINMNKAPTVFAGGISMTNATGSRTMLLGGLGDVTVNGFSSPWTTAPTGVSINSLLVGTLTITGTSDFGGASGSTGSLLRAYSHSTVLIQGSRTTTKQSHLSSLAGGKILLDLTAGSERWGGPMDARSSLYMRGGTLEVLGSSSDTRSQAFGTMILQNSRGSSNLLVNSNGGPGTTIYIGGNSWGGFGPSNTIAPNTLTPVGSMLLDVSAPNAHAKVYSASTAYLLNNTAGGQDPTSGVAQYLLVKDSTGIGYATQITNGGDRDVLRYTGAAPLTATVTGNATNYKIESSSVTLNAVTPGDGFNTLSIDTSAGGGTLDLGANAVFSNGILITGGNDYTISNGTLTGGLINAGAMGNRTAMFYHYGTGLLNFSGAVHPDANITKTGPGTMAFTGSSQLNNKNVIISGGALRTALTGQLLSGTETLQLTGGVLESNGVFNRTLGTNPGNVNFGGTDNGVAVGGGFAAHGGNLIINLNGNSTTAITLWTEGTSPLLFNGMALMLNSRTADSMVDFQNPIALGLSSQAARVIEVDDNPNLTTDFARISGVISGGTNAIGGTPVVKAGPGLLQFTAVNTYVGSTTVLEGTLIVTSSGVINAASEITVKPDAAFGGAGTVGRVIVDPLGTLLLDSDVVDVNGLSATSVTLGDDSSLEFTLGTLNGMLTAPDFLAESGLTSVNLNLNYSGTGLTVGQTLTLVDYTNTNFNTADVSQFLVSSVGALLEGTLFWDTGDTALKFTVTAIPEPATWVLLGLAAALGIMRRRAGMI